MNDVSLYLQGLSTFFSQYLPVKNPVLILSLTLLIILFSPLLFKTFRIPGIIGLILAGVIIGPNSLHIIESINSFELLSKTGLLYIMFLAGLEIDMQEFRQNRSKSLTFGFLTFSIPILIGYLVCIHIFHFEFWPALLLASMFSTHTLLSYPIVSNMGIIKNRAVQVAFGGTIITDSAVLILLGIITKVVRGDIDGSFWLQVALSLGFLVFATLYLLPRISRWFFRNIEGQASSHYIFVLAMVFISSFLSELAGVEPIIGAFLAGLGLNKVIPHTGILMNRIIFIGNTLFIPFFLISAGMLVDPRLFIQGKEALIFAGILSLVGVVTKYLAAWSTAAIFRYSRSERNILFGLSVSHAAATLAIIKAGFDLGLFDQNVINGTILLILISCLFSSFVSERAARDIAIQEKDLVRKTSDKPERILIPVSNPDNIQRLIDFALLIKDQKSQEPLYPLSIVEDDADADEKINLVRKVIEGVAEQIASGDKKVEVLKKVDLSIVDGIVRTAKAYNISDILISYKPSQSTGNLIFGGVAENLLAKSKQSVILSRILQPLSTFERVLVVLSPNAELENGFSRACMKLQSVLRQLGSASIVYGGEGTLTEFSKAVGDRRRAFYKYVATEDFESIGLLENIRKDDLVLILNARRQTLSYNYQVDDLQRRIYKQSEFSSFVVLYPELPKALQEGRISDIASPILAQRYAKVRALTGKITGIFKKDDEPE